jgi:hypothetical protein
VQDSTPTTEEQQQLATGTMQLAMSCTPAVSTALQHESSSSTSAGTTAEDMHRRPEVSAKHPVVLTRHHMECVAFNMAILQLMLRMKTHQKQQDSNTSSAQRLSSVLAAAEVPAPLQRMLQQLGISSTAAAWGATRFVAASSDLLSLQSFQQIETALSTLANDLIMLHDHSVAILCTAGSTPLNLSKQLLQEVQQQLQLSILLPSVLLQWRVDHTSCSSSDSCSRNSTLACSAAASWTHYYHKVLQDGPSSLHLGPCF